MLCLQRTLSTWEENLALDEVLLNQVEQFTELEFLRFWEMHSDAVILGRGGRFKVETEFARCLADRVPIFRRCSGGGAVVGGKGCLMYGLMLSLHRRPQLRYIDQAHRFVLNQMQAALARIGLNAQLQGDSDLTVANKKFSGNSMRLQRHSILYHGTLLLDFDLTKIGRYLRHPPREPEYRQTRAHGDFVTNLHVDPSDLMAAIQQQWRALNDEWHWSELELRSLVEQRYLSEDWNLRR